MLTFQWDNVKEKYFWSSDPECSQYRTRFVVRHSLQTRALVSYPGSGNTWIRKIYQGFALVGLVPALLSTHWSRAL